MPDKDRRIRDGAKDGGSIAGPAYLLKDELKRNGVTYAQLVERLAELGISEKEANIANKLSRGKLVRDVLSAMPRSIWNEGIEVFGARFNRALPIILIILMAMGAGALAVLSVDTFSPYEHESSEKNYYQAECYRLELTKPIFATVEDQKSPEGRKAQAEWNKNYPPYCELAAQFEASNSARSSSQYAAWTLILTFVGVVLLALTLKATSATLRAAQDTLKQTAEGTEAAKISADAAYSQLRLANKPMLSMEISGPYIDWDKFTESGMPAKSQHTGPRYLDVRANLLVKNNSRNVATIIYAFAVIAAKIAPRKNNRDFKILQEGDTYRLHWAGESIASPDELSSFGMIEATDENRDGILTGHIPPIIGKVQYRDSLNNIYELGFAFIPFHPLDAKGWKSWGEDAYNYDRQIQESDVERPS